MWTTTQIYRNWLRLRNEADEIVLINTEHVRVIRPIDLKHEFQRSCHTVIEYGEEEQIFVRNTVDEIDKALTTPPEPNTHYGRPI